MLAACDRGATGGAALPEPAPPEPAPNPLASAAAEGSSADAASADAVTIRQPGAAWRLRRISTGEVLADHQAPRLREPILPGSVAKVVTALAALEQGRGDERVICATRLTLHDRTLDCAHPPRAEPFGLADALAQSCNTFFTRLGATLDIGAWQRLAARLGVPPPSAADRPALMAIGLEGPRLSAESWQGVVQRALTDSRVPAAHRRVLREGLRGASTAGTAAALADPWNDTLAKTGTSVDAGGADGLAVVLRPDADLDMVVRVRGAGRDAAAVAAAVLATTAPDATVLQVGRRDDQPADAVPLEAYVARVVAAEGTPHTPPAALAALAVTVRGYALANRGRHRDEGFDLCDSTHCQVVARAAWPQALAAAAATRGLIQADAGRPMPVYYGAVCDGHLASSAETWGGDEPTWSLVGPEPYAHAVPTWQSRVAGESLAGALRGAGLAGDVLRDVRIGAVTPAGRPLQVILEGLRPDRLPADRFRTIVGRHLGWDVLKSHTWQIARTAEGYRFDGRGKGHGVGLCLAGAAVAAAQGLDAFAILGAYFPTLSAASMADQVTLRVSSASQARAPALLRTIHAELAGLRGRLQQAVPRRVTVVEHPTVEAYQRATGRAWWTGGATRAESGGSYRIDLPPLAVLEGAGRLEWRVRHELVHVLTDTTLADAPAWAREGLATHLSGAVGALGAPPHAPCPDDQTMIRPGSGDAMRAVYLEAAGCVARALGGDERRWRRLDAP